MVALIGLPIFLYLKVVNDSVRSGTPPPPPPDHFIYLFLLFIFYCFYNVFIVYLYSLYVHMVKLYLSVFERLLSVFNVNCMHQGSESNAISILCMYVMYMWKN